MQVEHTSLQKAYKGYTLYGSAQCEFGSRNQWSAIGSVLLLRPDNTCLQVDRVHYPLLKYDDEDLSKWFGLGLAEIAVDEFLPPVAYLLRPMDVGWAVDILRRAADECKVREIRRPKLYEALNFLEQSLEQKWLVRRYRRELRGDRRNDREKTELREALRVATRGIQQACVVLLVDKINELAVGFRENKPEIDKLRRQLDIVRRPVPR